MQFLIGINNTIGFETNLNLIPPPPHEPTFVVDQDGNNIISQDIEFIITQDH